MAHLFLAFLYSTRFLSKVATESLGLYCKAFPLPTPLDWTFASTRASSRFWGVGPGRWLFVSQPSGTFYFAVCHAVRHGRPQSLPLSIYSDPPWPSATRRPNGSSPVSAAGFRERGGFPTVFYSDGILDKQGSKVMFTQQILHFLHVTSTGRYMAARGGEKGSLTWRGIILTFTLFFSGCYLSALLSLSASVCISLCHPICHLLTTSVCHKIPHTPKLTLILAFKLSNY